MSTGKEIIEDILNKLAPLQVRARAMFGEYGIYCDEKIVALVCADTFFLKPTAAADSTTVDLEPCPPYPGAKDYLILDDRFMRDPAQFKSLIQATANALPPPKPKKTKRGKTSRKKA